MSYQAAREAEKLLAHNREVVVATITATEGSSPRHVGSFMVFSRSGKQWGTVGGGKVEAAVIEESRKAFDTRTPQSDLHYDLRFCGENPLEMACGGACDVRIEYFDGKDGRKPHLPLPEPATAYLFGAGHVNTALEPILRSVDFQTVVIDERPEYADPARFPEAKKVVCVDSYEEAASSLQPGVEDYVVIATPGHSCDDACLRGMLGKEFAYVGMIGSKNKVAYLFDQLRSEGCPEEQIAEVHSPIGEPIGSETPGEIAISITAQMVKVRSARRNGGRVR